MGKPQCKIDGCERHRFATEDVCLPHWRMLTMTLGDEPESPPPPGDSAPPAPAPPAAPAPPEPQQPTISATKAAWVEWAVHRHGVTRETAESCTKRQLIDLCTDQPAGDEES